MSAMPKPQPDPNEDAARLIRDASGPADPLPHDLERAWAQWSRAVQATDKRTMTLLRAAFEAGHQSGSARR